MLKTLENDADWFHTLQNCPVTGNFLRRLAGEKSREGHLMRPSRWVLVCLQVGEVWERIGQFWLWKRLDGQSGEIEKFNESLGLIRREIRLA
jgi:hypothetical protein